MKKNPADEDDLRDVVQEEIHRGRRGVVDTAARRRQRHLAQLYLRALEGTLEDYRYAISALHAEGTTEHEALLAIWYEKHGRRGPRTP